MKIYTIYLKNKQILNYIYIFIELEFLYIFIILNSVIHNISFNYLTSTYITSSRLQNFLSLPHKFYLMNNLT